MVQCSLKCFICIQSDGTLSAFIYRSVCRSCFEIYSGGEETDPQFNSEHLTFEFYGYWDILSI